VTARRLALALLSLAGCTATMHPPVQAAPVAEARLFVLRLERPDARTPREPLPVHLDARPLAALHRNEFVSVRVAAGEHVLALPGISAKLQLEADAPRYCRLSAVPGSPIVAWQLRCSDDDDGLAACTHGTLDPTVDWQE
jgi:hypothetical protein